MCKKIAMLLMIINPFLWADYETAMEEYRKQAYEKAIPMLEEAAFSGDKRAQYQLGNIYEFGLAGQKKDLAISVCYYKMVSSNYNYCEVEPLAEDASILDHLAAQQDSLTDKKMEHFLTNKLDTPDSHTQDALSQVISSDFGLYAYKKNYFLPVSQADEKYPVWSDAGPTGEEHESKTEAVFQISLKKPLSFDLFGLNEAFVFAYTQKVWWQLYSDSEPLREMRYEPEFFMTLPTTVGIDEATGLKAVKFGFSHQSNGQDGKRSRTWNRLYASTLWQHGQLFTNLRAWYRIPEPENTDENPDIHKYMGYGDLTFNYLYGKHQLGLLLRNNLDFDDGQNRGAVQVDWSYPFFNANSTYWYLQYFNGYGESLIDYNRKVQKVGFGLSFSRNVF
jgi:phospholipase A1